ncbi:MAG: phosphoribosylformylglycinamidine synthase subunit PurL [Pirellulaceae bacterium]|nr:phosphoribosylformylglycinamidine synthase subunit PurL [Pirellulaceae bacterium]
MTLWEVDIHPVEGQPDLLGRSVAAEAADLGLDNFVVQAARGFLVQGEISSSQIHRLSRELLADLIVECPVVGQVGERLLAESALANASLIHVLPKPGVTDPVAASTRAAIRDFEIPAEAVVTLRKYWVSGLSAEQINLLATKLLANDSIEQVVIGPLTMERIHLGSPYEFELSTVPIRNLSGDELLALSKARTLSLTLPELETIQRHFRELVREPTDIELETIAQTWSEHCSHKTLTGRVTYTDENGTRHFGNLLKETIFAATQKIRQDLGSDDWCVSVFRDNAGVVRFDDTHHVAFKVETHNRPSAIEPYGGANTGVGGVIRDTLGTGLGAKPICNTDVFCFAPPDTPASELPPGVLHPRRVMRGVVSGVRDYGNRMGIPTVNGAIYFDPRYVGNPLVFCGDVGLIPHDKAFKETKPGDLIVAIGGRTGRDGIHGATFSSAELTHESEKVSGGAVQIGNAIAEKMVLDVLLAARDEGLYTAVTDCGAGGFSSAVGEMGAEIGAEVWLERAPLKYEGLSYTEIWISEAQGRMVVSVPEAKWPRLEALCRGENVEAVVIGRFVPTGKLLLQYHGTTVGQLDMHFLHEGRPKVQRQATYKPSTENPKSEIRNPKLDPSAVLLGILGSLNVASKEWVIRQYDHEVQGGSVIKPLVGVANDGPSDAAVLRPVLSSRRGLAIACGMNPRYGDWDTYHMAACAIDEAVRNCVAVGADPARIAILDNFCWGYTDRPETLGALVRAALACYDLAVALGTPFISGKDSLNNEFSYVADGERRTIQIPHTLLISALGQVPDVGRCVTMDFKSAGNLIYQVGWTKNELSGSHLELVGCLSGSEMHRDAARGGEKVHGATLMHPTSVPQVDAAVAKRTFTALHTAMSAGLVRACHDPSEGGLAVAVAEMAFAGGWGAKIRLADTPRDGSVDPREADLDTVLLFAESASRFVVEVMPANRSAFEHLLQTHEVPHAHVGEVAVHGRVQFVASAGGLLIDLPIEQLKEAWQKPLRW